MLGEAEQKVIDQIASSPLGARLRKVAALPRITAEVVRRIAVEHPAVYVSPGELPIDGDSVGLEFDVLCVSKNARGYEAATRGDQATVGLYEMVDALLALTGPGATHGIIAKRARVLRSSEFEEVGIYAAVVTVALRESIPAEIDAATLDAFVTFDEKYDLDKSQTGEPVAEDTVTLPQ